MARSILARGDGLALDRQGGLIATEEAATERLSALMISGGSGVTTVKRTNGGVYGIRAHGSRQARARDRLAVLIYDGDREQPGASHLIREIYAVPPQCAQLVASLLSGKSLEQHAAEAGISRNTAKFHLTAAFEATGTRRQIDLIRQVAPLIAALSPGVR